MKKSNSFTRSVDKEIEEQVMLPIDKAYVDITSESSRDYSDSIDLLKTANEADMNILVQRVDHETEQLDTIDGIITSDDFLFVNNKSQADAYKDQLNALENANYCIDIHKKNNDFINAYNNAKTALDERARTLKYYTLSVPPHAHNDNLINKIVESNIGLTKENCIAAESKGCQFRKLTYSKAATGKIIYKSFGIDAVVNSYHTETLVKDKLNGDNNLEQTSFAKLKEIEQHEKQSAKSSIKYSILKAPLIIGLLLLFFGIFIELKINDNPILTMYNVYVYILFGVSALFLTIFLCRLLAGIIVYNLHSKELNEIIDNGKKQIKDKLNKIKQIPEAQASFYGNDYETGYNKFTQQYNKYIPASEAKHQQNKEKMHSALSYLPSVLANDKYLLEKVITVMLSGQATEYKDALRQAQQIINNEKEAAERQARENRRDAEERAHRNAVLESQKQAEAYSREQALYAKQQAEASEKLLESQKRMEDYAKKQADEAENQSKYAKQQAEYEKQQADDLQAIHRNQRDAGGYW